MYFIGVLMENFGIVMYKAHGLRPEIVVIIVKKVK
jgi:hypothetical protein